MINKNTELSQTLIVYVPLNICKSCLNLLYADLKEVKNKNVIFVFPKVTDKNNIKREKGIISMGFQNFYHVDMIPEFEINAQNDRVKYILYDANFNDIFKLFIK
ncbi:MAG: hypothetical protein R3Y26_09910 [Rikenellaceae bacterium]